MPTGGFNPLPFRCGGGKSRVQSIYESLNQSLGTAYDTSDASNVTAETMAEARALEAAWSANRRLSLQWDPRRVTDFLTRWEAIFNLHPLPTDSVADRRSALTAKFKALIGPAALVDVCTEILGDSFVDIEATPLASAYQRWPANGFPNDWLSETAHILIRVRFTANQSESQFLTLMGKLDAALGDLLPAWATWDWATAAESTSDGFYLDEPSGAGPPPTNLNYESFDS